MRYTTQNIIDAAKTVYEDHDGFDGELVEPRTFLNLIIEQLERQPQTVNANGSDIGKGSVVRVVKGQKVPHGTEGEVFWIKEETYDGTKTVRIGIKDQDGKAHWTYAHNVVAAKTSVTDLIDSI